jgi:hypothetical protein
MLFRQPATFELAASLHRGEATIGQVYSFISGLYFRGKVVYADAFSCGTARVIVPGAGLLPLGTPITLEQIRTFSGVSIERDYEMYRAALLRDALLLAQTARDASGFILLGSIATAKYSAPLLDVFGERLMFPSEFVGRGDMSRGGLMLRAARAGVELEYSPVAGAVLRGTRPPKLSPLAQK